MNWAKIIKLQIQLDKQLSEAHNYNDYEVFSKKKLALIVELAELVNEIKVFKYWSLNREINFDKALFEYADCMHFILSFAIQFKIDINDIKLYSNKFDGEISDFILLVIKKCMNIENKETCSEALSHFLYLGNLLNFSDLDIEKYYLLKNEINFKRIKDKY